jgi:hypothetical protein
MCDEKAHSIGKGRSQFQHSSLVGPIFVLDKRNVPPSIDKFHASGAPQALARPSRKRDTRDNRSLFKRLPLLQLKA